MKASLPPPAAAVIHKPTVGANSWNAEGCREGAENFHDTVGANGSVDKPSGGRQEHGAGRRGAAFKAAVAVPVGGPHA